MSSASSACITEKLQWSPYLGHDELLKVDVLGEGHSACMNAKYAALGLRVWQREFYLPIDSARPDKRRIQSLNLVGSHDDLQNMQVPVGRQDLHGLAFSCHGLKMP